MAMHAWTTDSAQYNVGLDVTIANNATNCAQSIVTLTPYLCRTQTAVKRSQHRWYLRFYMDGKEIVGGSFSYLQQGGNKNNLLPNDTAQANVVKAGYLQMEAKKWYQWGNRISFPVDNNGKSHTFGIRLECVDTIPREGPKGTLPSVTNAYKFVKYNTKPFPPKFTEDQIALDYNVDTGELTYRWSHKAWPSNVDYININCKYYDSSNKLLQTSALSNSSGSVDLKESDKTCTETIPEDTAYVKYTISSNNYKDDSIQTTLSDEFRATIETYSKVWIKVNGNWVKAIPWVNVNGVWRKVIKTYVNVDGVWQRTIM